MKLETGKPLGHKAYGSIPHLPGSRMGPGDHHCHDGSARIATVKTRDKNDRVYVSVKLDGSCVSVAKINGEIVALGKAGYLASSSRFEQHHMLAEWVEANQSRFAGLLGEGERIVGEWLAQAHGTRYENIHVPFVPFDIFDADNERIPYLDLVRRISGPHVGLSTPSVISFGPGAFSIDEAIEHLRTPLHGEVEPVEGAVWRVERNGVFDFMCKWVRPDKVDGKYLPEVSGSGVVWNWRP
jgi:hypothetical protein